MLWRHAFWMFVSALAAHATVLDRIAVTVGKQVITESDVILDLRVSAFLDQKPVDLTGEQKRKSADRLVEQTLILKEAEFSRVPLVSDADKARAVEQVKAQFGSEAEYRAALERYRIAEADLMAHLEAGLRAMRFTDLRFRPEIQLSEEDLHELYDTLAAEWKRKNPAEVPTFEASRDQVEKLLTEQRVAQALDRWLGAQRSETRILYKEPVFK
jgi:hypothetical protein